MAAGGRRRTAWCCILVYDGSHAWERQQLPVDSSVGPCTCDAWVPPHSTPVRLVGTAGMPWLGAARGRVKDTEMLSGTAKAASAPDDVHNVWALPQRGTAGHLACLLLV